MMCYEGQIVDCIIVFNMVQIIVGDVKVCVFEKNLFVFGKVEYVGCLFWVQVVVLFVIDCGVLIIICFFVLGSVQDYVFVYFFGKVVLFDVFCVEKMKNIVSFVEESFEVVL